MSSLSAHLDHHHYRQLQQQHRKPQQRIKLSRELMVRLSEALAARAARAPSNSVASDEHLHQRTSDVVSQQPEGRWSLENQASADASSPVVAIDRIQAKQVEQRQLGVDNKELDQGRVTATALPIDLQLSSVSTTTTTTTTTNTITIAQKDYIDLREEKELSSSTNCNSSLDTTTKGRENQQAARPPPGKRRSRQKQRQVSPIEPLIESAVNRCRKSRHSDADADAAAAALPVIQTNSSNKCKKLIIKRNQNQNRHQNHHQHHHRHRRQRRRTSEEKRCDNGISGANQYQSTCWRPRATLLWAALLLTSLALALASGSPQSATPTAGNLGGADVELSRAVLATMSTEASPYNEQQSNNASATLLDLATSTATPTSTLAPIETTNTLMDNLLDFGRIFIMGAIIIGDICGNSLVILSVCRHSKLRVTTNWFVVSLACADILVALFAMTFNASVIISGRWLFSQWVCDFWNSCDVLASTASILHLCCISIDRYIAITRPLDYPMKITTRRVMYALCGVWISSALLSYIPIFTGVYTTAEHINWLQENPDQCDFVVNRVYAIVSSSISFWIPSSIMVFTYYRIYKEATRQEKFIYKAQSMMPQVHQQHQQVKKPHVSSNNSNHQHQGKQRRSKSVAVASLGSTSGGGMKQLARQQYELSARPAVAAIRHRPDVPAVTLSGPRESGNERAASLLALDQPSGNPAATTTEPAERDPLALDLNNNSNSSSNNNSNKSPANQQKPAVSFQPPTPEAPEVIDDDDDDDQDSNSGQSTPTKRSISKMKREHKAAKTLGIIMGVFILCWLPFFSWYTPQHICGHACDGIVPRSAVTILFWIGYFNSTLNPIIYAYFNHEFRDAFKKTLQWIFCCCKDLKCLRVQRPNDNQHYNCTYRSTQEIGLVSNS